ncbi:MAG: hypothetical protein KZQ64_04620 [gamma proteobacterium symbiont of Bathyaustriella thionipta]|nr:hypothetical protein [gamma proteobacterium symbiont of Bathyaustriella thionipta]MCU7949335.1 hypothetical protein [gamma proteobacterium symbiont of Bathyaustriella thionipta]MCU7952663.1 hypothetical protein [gamma proteobacterium symbiont of Bathyaustriella thionipta]MCU7955540.1 hypothetical protein [gamma proteobacterium symbiont of Bathyaustriella thionipta]MCU7968295.1 hypothetical protein [gamma proteobacterium symbiont of Bathyaustriella thionipta]
MKFIGYEKEHQPSAKMIHESLFGDRKDTFRKGRINSWKTDIPVKFHDEINTELECVMKQWGYDI